MIFDYFFFKFYKIILKSGIPEFPRFYASLLLGGLINLNLLIFNTLLEKFDRVTYLFDNIIAGISLSLIVAFIFIIYNNSRIEAIKLRFSAEEFQPKKKKLNILFVLYIVLTALAMFLVPLWEPGCLLKMWRG